MGLTLIKLTGPNIGKDVSLLLTAYSVQSKIKLNQWNLSAKGAFGILMHFEVESLLKTFRSASIQVPNGHNVISLPAGTRATIGFIRSGGIVRGGAGLEDVETLFRSQSHIGNNVLFNLQYMTLNRDMSTQTRLLTSCAPTRFDLGKYDADGHVRQWLELEGNALLETG